MRILPGLSRCLCTNILLVISLCVAGLLHHQTSRDTDPDIAAYIAMGGSLSDICGDIDGAKAAPSCDYCRISEHAVLSPETVLAAPLNFDLPTDLLAHAARIHLRKRRDPNLNSRAPPQA